MTTHGHGWLPRVQPEPLGSIARTSAGQAARVLVVSDVRLYRESLVASLASRSQFSDVVAADDADDALRLLTLLSPDAVIVEMAMRDSLGLIRRLRHADADVLVVGFGVEEVEGEVLACAEAGLAGYVPPDASLDELVERVASVLRGELLCTPRMAAALFRRLEVRESAAGEAASGVLLTARERQVLTLIDRGLSNKEIAGRLHIQVSTVKNHVHNLLEKMHVSSRSQAAAHLGSRVSVRRRGLTAAAGVDAD